jgi:hypothetical protein
VKQTLSIGDRGWEKRGGFLKNGFSGKIEILFQLSLAQRKRIVTDL